MDILGLIRRLPEIVAYDKFDDDFFDRLNYSHTVAILTIFAIIVTNRQFSENQIKCWVPAQFTGSYEQYVNQICFIKNTYSYDMNEPLKDNIDIRHENELKYYQWTPFILLLMAILFYIPRQFWRCLSLRSGVDLKDLIEAAQTYRSANIRHEDKIKLLEYLTNWLNSYCSNSYRLITLEKKKIFLTKKAKLIRFIHCFIFPTGIYTGNYLIISYLFIKFLYLINSVGQILLLNTLLGRNFRSYGIDIIYRYWTKQISLLHTDNDYFPKVVLCDFSVREPNHVKESHLYTVQCVLPFNLFNQQIFTYLYFWLLILTFFNIVSISIWFYRMSSCTNFHYLERRLLINFFSSDNNHLNEKEFRDIFVNRYLQRDGTFMIRLLAANVNDYVCTKIILELYKKFRTALLNKKIGRESLFETIQKEKDDDNDDESTDQTIADFPPIPNLRHGKIFIEHDTPAHSLSETSSIEPPERRRAVSFSLPLTIDHEQKYLQNFQQIDSSDRLTPRRKSVEFNLEPEITPSLTPSSPSTSSPPMSTLKILSPYATTYLTMKKLNEQELPYVDDSISSTSTNRQSQKPTPTNSLFQRSHDV